MADIAVATANRLEIVESILQATLPAVEAILAGAPVRIDTAGKFANGNGGDATEGAVYGIATRTVAAGESLTAIRVGILDGFTFTQAYWAPIYVSNTDARLGDAAGTVSVKVGNVIPAWAQLIGTAADKLLHVQFVN